MEHQGRHALVTGGNAGIGLAIARSLADDGATVTITGRRTDLLNQLAAEDDRLHALQMDVSDEDSVRQGIADAAKARGPISICVANAGIAEGQPFASVALDDWRRMMSINLDGAFLTLQSALATLGRDDWGRMIVVSSIAGVHGLKGAIPYTVSKHGMIGLIRGLSEEYMGSRITFNAICPGYVETDIVTNQAKAIAKRQGITEEEATAYMAKGNRHRTLLQVDEVAASAHWLCSEGARSVNGQTIQIAGGQIA
ncbi:SDR family NAD(P)-dependent oxidoreductase [Aestuariibius sp. 2305UL40-4]|uniref:SDR family NAD(P)-dependent oxidoreductase n=1 Tax=Aestuariibius violaceus TaxID=3234132 RepID=UPI00345E07D1